MGPCKVGCDVPETGTDRDFHGNEHPGDALCLDLSARPAATHEAMDDRMDCHLHPLYGCLAIHFFSSSRELVYIFQSGNAGSGGRQFHAVRLGSICNAKKARFFCPLGRRAFGHLSGMPVVGASK